jgi:hypothetical protein
MGFWREVLAGFLGNIAAAVVVVVCYIAVQWFLGATDIKIGYTWAFDGGPGGPTNIRPCFEVRNRSRSKTYVLANVAYFRGGEPAAPFDSVSLWGKEMKPGSIQSIEAAPLRGVTTLKQCEGIEVHIRLQTGRMFWLKGKGPGQLQTGIAQRVAFWLRDKFERGAIPLE